MGNCCSHRKHKKYPALPPISIIHAETLLTSLAASERKRSGSHVVIRTFNDNDIATLKSKGLRPVGRKYALDVLKSHYILRDEVKGWIAICDDVSAYSVLAEEDDSEELWDAVFDEEDPGDIVWIELRHPGREERDESDSDSESDQQSPRAPRAVEVIVKVEGETNLDTTIDL